MHGEDYQMPYVTSVEQIGLDRGLHVGEAAGQRSLVSLLLEQKFGGLSDRLNDRVNGLSSEQLKALAILLLRFESIDDLTSWLENYG
jgi:ABC-type uncharacterized transport system ATPase component